MEEANAVAEQDEEKWNWYIDTLFEDIARDLVETQGISYDMAVSNIYNAGYEIHCAMDVDLQTDLEELFLKNTDMLPYDPAVELGFFMMDPYTGQVMGVIGQRYERTGIRLHNNTTMSKRQPGSSIKPIGPYALGISTGEITYGSVLKDENPIRVFQRTQPLCDNKFRRIFQIFPECRPDRRLRCRIDRTGAVVENQDLRLL